MMRPPSHCIYAGDRDLSARRVAVVGLARSGLACVDFLAARGARVLALDARPREQLGPEAAKVLGQAEAVIAPYSDLTRLPPLDLMVVSPGVPSDAPLVQQARQAGVEVIGEMELAYRFCDAPMVTVTGTCGKGTTVTALGALLEAGGVLHVVAGNIGLPLIGQVARSHQLEVVVAEVSSFQLETTVHLHPWIAVLLNVTEDHLERYPDFGAYVAAKRRLFCNQVPGDWAILVTDDPHARQVADDLRGAASPGPAVLTVGLRNPSANGRLEGQRLVVQLPGSEPQVVAERTALPLSGDHHVTNFLVAALCARLLGVPAAAIETALRGYRAAPHLMELVGEFDGVRYIDDSKATNPASAIADLEGVSGPLIVIAGGKEKNTDFGAFGQALAARAKLVVLMGECAGRIARAVGRPELCRIVGSMEEAVQVARQAARPGDAVVLAPACSSLDMFASYAQRGEAFAQAVVGQVGQGAVRTPPPTQNQLTG